VKYFFKYYIFGEYNSDSVQQLRGWVSRV